MLGLEVRRFPLRDEIPRFDRPARVARLAASAESARERRDDHEEQRDAAPGNHGR
jgi:hypothetical protein